VTVPGALVAAVADATRAHGPPDLLVYAAGVPVMGKTLDVLEEEARRAFEVNFWGLDRAVRAVLPIMAERRRGAILGVSSLVALRPVPHEAHYAASKAAAARYLGAVAFEAAKAGVRVKVLHVGYVATGFAERGGWFGMRAPSGERGSSVTPSDVAEAAIRLLSSSRAESVLGWKERAIALGDRLFPELYDRWLRVRGRSA
jgi:short-subunit dehydrogenase